MQFNWHETSSMGVTSFLFTYLFSGSLHFCSVIAGTPEIKNLQQINFGLEMCRKMCRMLECNIPETHQQCQTCEVEKMWKVFHFMTLFKAQASKQTCDEKGLNYVHLTLTNA